jgi:hypothetical protein
MKKFKSYDQVVAYMVKARSPANGRPLPVSGCRFMPGDTPGTYKFERYGASVVIIRPDNALEFLDLPRDFALGYALYAVFGFDLIKRAQLPAVVLGAERYEVFTGLEIDMTTHIARNPRPSYTERVDKDVRRQWLRDRKAWTKGFLVRHRMGTYNGTCPPYSATAGAFVQDWTDAIKTQQFPVPLCAYITRRFLYGATAQERLRQLFDHHSYLLREEYGVFDGG